LADNTPEIFFTQLLNYLKHELTCIGVLTGANKRWLYINTMAIVGAGWGVTCCHPDLTVWAAEHWWTLAYKL